MIIKIKEFPNYQQFVNTQPLYSGVSADGSTTQEFTNIEVLEEGFQSQEVTALDPETLEGGTGMVLDNDSSGLDGSAESGPGVYS